MDYQLITDKLQAANTAVLTRNTIIRDLGHLTWEKLHHKNFDHKLISLLSLEHAMEPGQIYPHQFQSPDIKKIKVESGPNLGFAIRYRVDTKGELGLVDIIVPLRFFFSGNSITIRCGGTEVRATADTDYTVAVQGLADTVITTILHAIDKWKTPSTESRTPLILA